MAAGLQVGLAKRPDPLRLDVEIPGGSQRIGELERIQGEDRLGVERDARAQTLQCALDVRPGGILRQDRPDHHLESGLRRPPVLLAEGLEQPRINSSQRCGVHSGNLGDDHHTLLGDGKALAVGLQILTDPHPRRDRHILLDDAVAQVCALPDRHAAEEDG